jgi:entericidin B
LAFEPAAELWRAAAHLAFEYAATDVLQLEETKMVRKYLALVAISAGLALSACNTVKGAGEDIESVGEAGDKAT